jgi:hypothetical protein
MGLGCSRECDLRSISFDLPAVLLNQDIDAIMLSLTKLYV